MPTYSHTQTVEGMMLRRKMWLETSAYSFKSPFKAFFFQLELCYQFIFIIYLLFLGLFSS